MEERIVSSQEQGEDTVLETNLRPKKLRDYVGQKSVKENLSISMEASRKACIAGETSKILSPDSEFFKFFGNIKPQ